MGGCFAGHTRLCCKKTASDAAIGTCKWEGASPFCSAVPFKAYGCDESDRKQLTYSNYGAGGEQGCYLGYKSMCCTQPPAFTDCAWYSYSTIFHPYTCNAGCPSGKTPIATDPSGCSEGYQFFCCSNPTKTPDVPTNTDFCYSTEGDFVEASEKDDDPVDDKDILELYWYEDECFSIPNNADPSVHKRASQLEASYSIAGLRPDQIVKIFTDSGVSFEIPLSVPWAQDILEQSLAADIRDVIDEHEKVGFGNHSLEERGGGRFSKICQANGNTINTFTTAAYPGAGGLIRNGGRLVYAATTTGGCLTLGLVKVAHSSIQAGVKIVVEHGRIPRTTSDSIDADR